MKRVLGIVTLVLSMGSLPGISLAASEDDRVALAAYLSTALTEDNGFRDRFDAEVWLVDMQQRLAPLLPDSQERLDLLTQVHQQASQLDLPPSWYSPSSKWRAILTATPCREWVRKA